jgi:hypothetical protein
MLPWLSVVERKQVSGAGSPKSFVRQAIFLVKQAWPKDTLQAPKFLRHIELAGAGTISRMEGHGGCIYGLPFPLGGVQRLGPVNGVIDYFPCTR